MPDTLIRRQIEPTAVSAIIVRRQDEKVFLGRRSLEKQSWPGLWEVIGGGIAPEETPVSCLLRRIREKLQVPVKHFRFFREYEFHRNVIRVYVVELAETPKPQTADLMEWGWFAKDDLRTMELAMDGKKRLLDYFASPEHLEVLRALEV